MKNTFHPLKSVCITLVLTFFLTNVVFAYSQESNLARQQTGFWSKRRKAIPHNNNTQLAQLPSSLPNTFPVPNLNNPYSLNKTLSQNLPAGQIGGHASLISALPSQFGTIRNITNVSAENTIIHIQDIHQNDEAQANIAKSVQSLIDQDQVDLIALEGAFKSIDLTPFRTFPDKETVRKLADYFLREHKISGPLHTALVSQKKIPPLVGVDDRQLYEANVKTVKESYPLKEKTKNQITNLIENLNQEKNQIFNPDLLTFNSHIDAYRRGTKTLGAHIRTLDHHSQKLERGLGTIPIFIEALNLEESLNFTQVEHERALLLKDLLQNLGPEDTQTLMTTSLAFRSGQLNHTAFYTYLQNLCKRNQIPLNRYQAMRDYLQYILLSNSINADKLFKEMRSLESTIFNTLAKTKKERELIRASRNLYLTEKLVDFALTKEEWEEYKKVRSPESVVRDLKMNNYHAPRTADHGLLQSFEFFYRHAEARDKAISHNLLAAMKRHEAKRVVLITGGFHSAGIRKELGIQAPRPLSTLTFVPKITKVESDTGSSYLSVFTQEKTPLEELFEGEKLFLAKEPLSQGHFAEATTILASSAYQKDLGSMEYPRHLFQTSLNWTQVVFKKIALGLTHISGIPPDENHYLTLVIKDTPNAWKISLLRSPLLIALSATFLLRLSSRFLGHDLNAIFFVSSFIIILAASSILKTHFKDTDKGRKKVKRTKRTGREVGIVVASIFLIVLFSFQFAGESVEGLVSFAEMDSWLFMITDQWFYRDRVSSLRLERSARIPPQEGEDNFDGDDEDVYLIWKENRSEGMKNIPLKQKEFELEIWRNHPGKKAERLISQIPEARRKHRDMWFLPEDIHEGLRAVLVIIDEMIEQDSYIDQKRFLEILSHYQYKDSEIAHAIDLFWDHADDIEEVMERAPFEWRWKILDPIDQFMKTYNLPLWRPMKGGKLNQQARSRLVVRSRRLLAEFNQTMDLLTTILNQLKHHPTQLKASDFYTNISEIRKRLKNIINGCSKIFDKYRAASFPKELLEVITRLNELGIKKNHDMSSFLNEESLETLLAQHSVDRKYTVDLPQGEEDAGHEVESITANRVFTPKQKGTYLTSILVQELGHLVSVIPLNLVGLLFNYRIKMKKGLTPQSWTSVELEFGRAPPLARALVRLSGPAFNLLAGSFGTWALSQLLLKSSLFINNPILHLPLVMLVALFLFHFVYINLHLVYLDWTNSQKLKGGDFWDLKQDLKEFGNLTTAALLKLAASFLLVYLTSFFKNPALEMASSSLAMMGGGLFGLDVSEWMAWGWAFFQFTSSSLAMVPPVPIREDGPSPDPNRIESLLRELAFQTSIAPHRINPMITPFSLAEQEILLTSMIQSFKHFEDRPIRYCENILDGITKGSRGLSFAELDSIFEDGVNPLSPYIETSEEAYILGFVLPGIMSSVKNREAFSLIIKATIHAIKAGYPVKDVVGTAFDGLENLALTDEKDIEKIMRFYAFYATYPQYNFFYAGSRLPRYIVAHVDDPKDVPEYLSSAEEFIVELEEKFGPIIPDRLAKVHPDPDLMDTITSLSGYSNLIPLCLMAQSNPKEFESHLNQMRAIFKLPFTKGTHNYLATSLIGKTVGGFGRNQASQFSSTLTLMQDLLLQKIDLDVLFPDNFDPLQLNTSDSPGSDPLSKDRERVAQAYPSYFTWNQRDWRTDALKTAQEIQDWKGNDPDSLPFDFHAFDYNEDDEEEDEDTGTPEFMAKSDSEREQTSPEDLRSLSDKIWNYKITEKQIEDLQTLSEMPKFAAAEEKQERISRNTAKLIIKNHQEEKSADEIESHLTSYLNGFETTNTEPAAIKSLTAAALLKLAASFLLFYLTSFFKNQTQDSSTSSLASMGGEWLGFDVTEGLKWVLNVIASQKVILGGLIENDRFVPWALFAFLGILLFCLLVIQIPIWIRAKQKRKQFRELQYSLTFIGHTQGILWHDRSTGLINVLEQAEKIDSEFSTALSNLLKTIKTNSDAYILQLENGKRELMVVEQHNFELEIVNETLQRHGYKLEYRWAMSASKSRILVRFQLYRITSTPEGPKKTKVHPFPTIKPGPDWLTEENLRRIIYASFFFLLVDLTLILLVFLEWWFQINILGMSSFVPDSLSSFAAMPFFFGTKETKDNKLPISFFSKIFRVVGFLFVAWGIWWNQAGITHGQETRGPTSISVSDPQTEKRNLPSFDELIGQDSDDASKETTDIGPVRKQIEEFYGDTPGDFPVEIFPKVTQAKEPWWKKLTFWQTVLFTLCFCFVLIPVLRELYFRWVLRYSQRNLPLEKRLETEIFLVLRTLPRKKIPEKWKPLARQIDPEVVPPLERILILINHILSREGGSELFLNKLLRNRDALDDHDRTVARIRENLSIQLDRLNTILFSHGLRAEINLNFAAFGGRYFTIVREFSNEEEPDSLIDPQQPANPYQSPSLVTNRTFPWKALGIVLLTAITVSLLVGLVYFLILPTVWPFLQELMIGSLSAPFAFPDAARSISAGMPLALYANRVSIHSFLLFLIEILRGIGTHIREF
ncbi:hypothetical protein BVX98_02140 [bacterium F11]|nr:hypothetical protein BVX98_02140 [bacterium F11]